MLDAEGHVSVLCPLFCFPPPATLPYIYPTIFVVHLCLSPYLSSTTCLVLPLPSFVRLASSVTLALTLLRHICLSDFGLAKEAITSLNDGASTFCGTPSYMAPEVGHRSPHPSTPPSSWRRCCPHRGYAETRRRDTACSVHSMQCARVHAAHVQQGREEGRPAREGRW